MSFADLGWQTLRNDPSAQASLPPVDASLTFAHPDHGVALVDMAPAAASNPVERLRRRLEALATEPTLAAELPIVYLPLEAPDLWRLNIILDSAFPSPLTKGEERSDWVDLVQRALLPETFPPNPAERDAGQPALMTGPRAVAARRPVRSRRLHWSLAAGALMSLLAGAAVIRGLDGVPTGSPPPTAEAEHAQAVPGRQEEVPAAPVLPRSGSASQTPSRGLAEHPGTTAPQPPRSEAASSAPPRLDRPGPAVRERLSSEPLRIVVHHLAGRGDMAARLVGSAADAVDEVEFRTVRATPQAAVVRYFQPSDKAAAEGLARRLGAAWRAQDLTRYRPRPSAGTLEVWLPRGFSIRERAN